MQCQARASCLELLVGEERLEPAQVGGEFHVARIGEELLDCADGAAGLRDQPDEPGQSR